MPVDEGCSVIIQAQKGYVDLQREADTDTTVDSLLLYEPLRLTPHSHIVNFVLCFISRLNHNFLRIKGVFKNQIFGIKLNK